MPYLEWSDSSADVSGGSWTTWAIRARMLRSGHTALAFEVHAITFQVRWSNPLWDWLDICPNDSSEQVLKVLAGIAAAMPPVPTAEISLDDMALGMGGAEDAAPVAEPSGFLGRTLCTVLALAGGFGYAAFYWCVQQHPPAQLLDPEPVAIFTPPRSPRDGLRELDHQADEGFAMVDPSSSHASVFSDSPPPAGA